MKLNGIIVIELRPVKAVNLHSEIMKEISKSNMKPVQLGMKILFT